MRELADGYSTEVDNFDKDVWYKIIHTFDDANIYQTWAYDETRRGRNNISHMILKKNHAIVAASQLRIVKLPVLNTGIAYVRWGPLFKPKGTEIDAESFCQAIRSLRNEYACRRGLMLRIYPILFSNESEKFLPVMNQEGFVQREDGKHDRTLLIDLRPKLEDLRKGLNQKWRNCLNRAERNSLEMIEGYDDNLFEMFMVLYKEMLDRKKFIEPNDINEFRLIQKGLPEKYKMKIMLCRFEGKLCAGAIFSAIGNTGLYLFGAINEAGMKSNGSYILQWKFIEWLKKNQFACYDLNGINPETNPGTYNFKEGLCGKNGKDVYFLGQFQTCTSPLSSISVGFGESLFLNYRKARTIIHSWQHTNT
jgi:FemAB family